ncbi:ATP-binding cassette domain-containing protein [Kaistia terrae]|uniref:ATP-binding cassette domain-containing protein n=1 Tax=Kaistia terrae TaxID=537017 RepID=A0ABW0PS89_9HYPH|nr:ATP-binding cassette domain-containing protein [Kaistia terrae]MCX5578557.1 ATP-binding cassette domain-containing protein [Kaistia terrae]
MSTPLLQARGLQKSFATGDGGLFGQGRHRHMAVDGIDLAIEPGTTLGCVGESGSGKSTLGRMLVGLIEPDEGSVTFDGQDVAKVAGKERAALRRNMQVVFQDPLLSLNPRRTIGQNIQRPLRNYGVGGSEAEDRMARLMKMCGLDPAQAARYPHEISGGQCQRVAIARALALEPRFVFLDEPVSALDVSVQAQILNLLLDLQAELGLTYFFVTHDLKLIEFMSQQVIVMLKGSVVERGTSAEIWQSPKHAYTQNLLRSVLRLGSTPDWARFAASETSSVIP